MSKIQDDTPGKYFLPYNAAGGSDPKKSKRRKSITVNDKRILLWLVKMEENASQGIADATVSQKGHVRSVFRKNEPTTRKEQNCASEIFEPAGPESTEANLRPEKIQ